MPIIPTQAQVSRIVIPLSHVSMAAVLGWGICRALRFKAGGTLDLGATQQTWSTEIASLVLVAGVIERANEVIVTAFRDRGADDLSAAEKRAASDLAASPGAELLKVAATTAADASVRYRSQTKEFAMTVALCFGLLAALAGVRSLHPLLLDPKAPTGRLFALLDIVITGAMLAGGSEGIHRLANVFTSGADMLSTKIDKAGGK